MTKKITAMLMAVLMVLALAGCFGETVDPTDPPTQPTTQPTTEPTTEPTEAPTTEPTAEPTEAPTTEPTSPVMQPDNTPPEAGTYAGVITLRINPEFAVYFNDKAEVVKVLAVNADAAEIMENFTGYEGMDCSVVLMGLVDAVGDAGYLDSDDADIEITIEAAEGTELDEEFATQLEADVEASVQDALEQGEWAVPLKVERPKPPVGPTDPSVPTQPTEPDHEHDYVEVDEIPATCTSGAQRIYECTICGDSYTGEPYSQYGHKYESVVVAATMQHGGYTENTCSVCGESYRSNETPKIEVDFTDVNETVYTTGAVNVRSGPSTGYEVVTTLAQGTAVTRTGIGSNGWSRVTVNGETAYIYSDYLSATEPGEEPDTGNEGGATTGGNNYTGGNGNEGEAYNPWDDYVQAANPATGISWDGKSPIVYTYEDGTTGYEPVIGATYEVQPYLYYEVTYWDLNPLPEKTEQEKEDMANGIYYCHVCGKVCGDGRNGTCVMWMLVNKTCEYCGTYIPVMTCHTCPEE